jgi:hypothetical protein
LLKIVTAPFHTPKSSEAKIGRVKTRISQLRSKLGTIFLNPILSQIVFFQTITKVPNPTNVKIPVTEGRESLEYLRSADLSTESFEEIKKHTDVLVRCGFSGGEVTPLKLWLFRGVTVKVEEIPLVKRVGRISYRPRREEDAFSLNRASTNKHQIFYGAVPTPEFDDGNIAAVLEIDTIREDDFPEDDYEYIAMGLWFVKKPFFVVNAGMHSKIAGNSNWAKNIGMKDKELFELTGHSDLIRDIMEFMGAEFGKQVPKDADYLYKISAAYGDSLFDRGIPAIMYPSLQTNGKTFNIAIRSEVVDMAGIDVEAAAVVRGSKIGKEVFWGWFLQCRRVFGDALVWEEPPKSTQIAQNDLARFRKLIEEKGEFPSNPKIVIA